MRNLDQHFGELERQSAPALERIRSPFNTDIEINWGVAEVNLGEIVRVPTQIILAAKGAIDTYPELGYQLTLGKPSVREAVAREFTRTDGIRDKENNDKFLLEFSADNTAVVEGTRGALYWMIRYTMGFLKAEETEEGTKEQLRGGVALGPKMRWPTYEGQIDDVTDGAGKYICVNGSEKSFLAPLAEDFRAELDAHPERDVRLLIIANPGNPIGSLYENADLLEIVKLAYERKIPILLDEAYEAFIFRPGPRPSIFQAVQDYPHLVEFLKDNLCIGRSLGKTYQRPGERAGLMLAPKKVISWMEKKRYGRVQSLNASAQAAIEAACGLPDTVRDKYRHDIISVVGHNRDRVLAFAETTDGLLAPYVGSSKNPPPASPLVFLNARPLYDLGFGNAANLVNDLAKLHLKVISGATSGDEFGLRIAIGRTPAENEEGIARLRLYLNYILPGRLKPWA